MGTSVTQIDQTYEGDRVDREGNAVIAWSSLPTDNEREVVDGCLR